MSGGRLVVLDRLGREVKRFSLPEGLATLGSDPACDIRVMLPSVSAHHATVVVHANQTVVRNVSEGETLVNGVAVSVAALRHGDVIGVGGRELRWDYAQPARRGDKPPPPQATRSRPATAAAPGRGRLGARGARRASAAAPPAALAREPALRLALELSQRASMPGLFRPSTRSPPAPPAALAREPALRLALELSQRASMPGLFRPSTRSPPAPPAALAREPALRLALELSQRASMPGLFRPSTRSPPAPPAALAREPALRLALELSQRASMPGLFRPSTRSPPAPPAALAREPALRLALELSQRASMPGLFRPSTRSPPAPPAALAREPALRLALELSQRASMPGLFRPSTRSPPAPPAALAREPALRLALELSQRASMPGLFRPSTRSPPAPPAALAREPALRLALELSQRASMPGLFRPSTRSPPAPPAALAREPALRLALELSQRASMPGLFRPSTRSPPAPPAALAREPALRLALELSQRASMPGLFRPSTRSPPAPPAALAREPALRLALELSQRASMPGSAGGKQVAIVQPQRRDTNDHNEPNPPRAAQPTNKRRTKHESDTSKAESESDGSKRRSSPRASPKNALQPTKATQWIESRKPSPRQAARLPLRRSLPAAKKTTPLRLAVLRKAQSAQKMRVTKIEAPLTIDHTKRAAIMLMTGHTPKSAKRSPSLLVKRASPVRRTPARRGRQAARRCKESSGGATPERTSAPSRTRSGADHAATVLEISDSVERKSTSRRSAASRRSAHPSPNKSTPLPSAKKSALKDPRVKKSMRKTESIKFDLSNLESRSQSVLMVTDATTDVNGGDSASEDDLTLRYTDSSSILSPSPRRSIHSRSSRMLEKSLGTSMTVSPSTRTLTPESPRARKSSRGSLILQKALDKTEERPYSRRSSKSSVQSQSATALSPRSTRRNLESYSIVDLISIDSNASSRSSSVYDSAGSISTAFGTPQNASGRKTRSTINPTLLGSSTPYVKGLRSSTRSQSNPNVSIATSDASHLTTRTSASRRSKSLSTPENTEDTKKQITMNSTKIFRASKSRSRLNDSDLLLVEGEENDDSPKSSKRNRKSNQASPVNDATYVHSPSANDGTITPENTYSPKEATTPMLSIQSLLDSSQSSFASYTSQKNGHTFNSNRKTIGGVSQPRIQAGAKSKSMSFTARKTRLRLSSDSVEKNGDVHSDEEVVTPKSAIKPVPEGVKNKHSTAKKPQSKRSIIDDLNESDIVKQLFNSPVKRKLSQSMTEFSRKQLFLDDDDIVQAKKSKRNTVAVAGRTPDNSLLNHSESFTPERFVSPINTPTNSPNLAGIKRLFAKNTPANDLTNVRGVKSLLRTPRTRKSIRNDLSDVYGVKAVFAKSPANRLSDVRIKEVFTTSPKNDLRRISGVKSLFQAQNKLKNDLSDVTGINKLLRERRSPTNDLRNVSGVKRTMRRHSPENDLSDVRGVKRMFREEKGNEQNNGLTDISGVEELFNTSDQSHRDTDSIFDRLVGRPPIRAVYSKTFSTRPASKSKAANKKSLHTSLDLITNNVGEWLEQELQKRSHKKPETSASKLADRSKNNLTRELQRLATETVEGTTPIRNSRVRNGTLTRSGRAEATERTKPASETYSARKLPIKKRSLVEKSMDKTKNDSKVLPIKKRVLLHSTPVKGRVHLTMNASELGRVSPIAAEDDTAAENRLTIEVKLKVGRRTVRTTNEDRASATSEPTPPSPKTTRGKSKRVQSPDKPITSPKLRGTRRAKAEVTKSIVSASAQETKLLNSGSQNVSPAKVGSSKRKSPSPAKPRATRSRKTVATPEMNARKRGAAVLVTKKTPIMSPKPRATRKKKEAVSSKSTPKKTREIRETVEEKPKTPKRRTTRKNVAEKVTTPKRKATRKQVEEKAQTPKQRETRKNVAQKVATPKQRANKKNVQEKPKTPKNTRARVQRGSVVVSKPSPALKPRAGRAKDAPERKRKDTDNERSPKVTKNAKNKTNRTTVAKQEASESEAIPKRGRRTKAGETIEIQNPTQKVKTARGRRMEPQASVESEPTTRSRRTKHEETAAESLKGRSASQTKALVKAAKSKESEKRGRKRAAEAERPKRAAQKAAGAGKTTDATVDGARVASRKRKTTVDPSPVKEASKKQPTGKKSRKTVESSPVISTNVRSTRNKKTAVEASKPPARSRRR